VTALPSDLPTGLYEIEGEVRERVTPTKPHRVFATTQAKLPPADNWRHCQAILSDARKLVISTYSGSAWEWTNTDGSPL
jgi:hypothetical protein